MPAATKSRPRARRSSATTNGKAPKANGRAPEVEAGEDDELPFEIENLDIDHLRVDKAYQRKLKDYFIREMRADFRPYLVGTPVISRRANGDEVLIDGQHRWVVLKEKRKPGKDGKRRWAFVVYTGLTREQEAQLFVDIQTRRKGMLSTETFTAMLVAKDPIATMLNEAVEAVGYKVAPRGTPGGIASPAALRSCLRRGVKVTKQEAKDRARADAKKKGERLPRNWSFPDAEAQGQALTWLETTLVLFRQAWKERNGSPTDVPEAWHIRGMYEFVVKHRDFDMDKMVRRLSIQSPGELNIKANHAKQITGGRSSNSTPYMLEAIEAVYAMTEGQVKKAQK